MNSELLEKMKLFEGKSPTERNKIIAAGVLGALALFALYFAFGGIGGGSTKITATVSSTPKPMAAPKANSDDLKLPSQSEQDFSYVTTAIDYRPGGFWAPGPGRNIFAFYEPPAPTPYSPTPFIAPPLKTPEPTPVPPMLISFVAPQSVYAGSKGFRLEVSGDKFTEDTRIYFSQNELPTTFINPQKLVADIPAGFISGEGPRQVIVQTPDGKFYSNQIMLNVQAPPKPEFQYIGMIARKRSNNDTAYFLEKGKPTPMGKRLNDIVDGRFRLLSISAEETILEDVNLGFRHRLPLFRPAPGTDTSSAPERPRGFPGAGGFPAADSYVPFNPTIQTNSNMMMNSNSSIPGIPDNIPRYVPPTPQRQPSDKKMDDDDDDGDN